MSLGMPGGRGAVWERILARVTTPPGRDSSAIRAAGEGGGLAMALWWGGLSERTWDG